MGKLQDNLLELISRTGKSITSKTLDYLRHDIIKDSEYAVKVLRIYKIIGGTQDEFPLNIKGWDIEVDGIGLELDEHLHFNRYRLQTLRSSIYADLPAFPKDVYVEYCEAHEQDCLSSGSYGGKWSNESCEKQFGPPGEYGDLTGMGAPRWKQRAFYDFVKDITPLLIGIPCVRISIWDTVRTDEGSQQLSEFLSDNNLCNPEPVWNLIVSRAGREKV